MRGLWLEDRHLSYRTDLPVPEPGPGEALVRVHLTGICRTDLELEKGYYPYSGVPGHEFVGTVAAAAVRPSLEGRRVVGEINAVCHQCDFCRRGLSSHCKSRSVLGIVGRNGAFAEYLVLPVENLREVPDSVPDRRAVFTEPLAAAIQVLEQTHIRPTDRVLLVGAGKLGQLLARVLNERGCNLLVKGRYPEQMQWLEAADIPRTELDPPEHAFDVVVEATGSPSGLETACRSVRPRGTVILKSTYEGRAEIDLSRIVVDEISLIGSRCGPFGPALSMLERGHVVPEGLVDQSFPLSQGVEAFRKAGEHGALKVLVEI